MEFLFLRTHNLRQRESLTSYRIQGLRNGNVPVFLVRGLTLMLTRGRLLDSMDPATRDEQHFATACLHRLIRTRNFGRGLSR